jgi:serine protease AprX
MQSMGNKDGTFKTPANIVEFFGRAYAQDARHHNNSWEQPLPFDPADLTKTKYQQLGYTPLANGIDTFMKTHDDSLVVFAAGNDGERAAFTDTGATIGSTATAKNSLTVGACESSRKMDWRAPAPPHYYFSKTASNKGDRDNIADFSNIGPTRNTAGALNNSRYKPDVVAPGTIICSARSRSIPLLWAVDSKTRLAQPDIWGVSDDKRFIFDSGTSMATPLVTGCSAVLRKLLLKRLTKGARVTGALLKALIINGTTDIGKGPRGRGPTPISSPPDNAQGFGRVNIAASIRNVTDTVNCGYWMGPPLTQDTSIRLPITIPSAPLLH